MGTKVRQVEFVVMAADVLAVEALEARQEDPKEDLVEAGNGHPMDATSCCRLELKGCLEALPTHPCQA